MASSGNNQIVVRGIPSHLNSDKLIIYFQRKRDVGGGDVQSVIFPKSKNEPDTAIVTFEDPETVQSVLKYNHKIAGKQVIVKENAYKKIFGATTTLISSFAIEEMRKRYADIEQKFYQVTDSTGAFITESDGNYEVSGDWLHVQAAFDRIADMVGCEDDQGEPDYLERPNPSKPPTTDSGHAPTPSTILDKDNFAFIQRVHQEELNKIGDQYGVTFDTQKIGGDAIKVSAVSTMSPASAEEAIKRVEEFYQKISDSAHQDDIKLDITVKGYKGIVDDVMSRLQPEFPRVNISKMHGDEARVMFIASTAAECSTAKDQFKYFFELAIATAERGGHKSQSGDIIQVDRDVFGYLRMAYGDKLQAICDDHAVNIRTNPIDDCVELHLEPMSDKELVLPSDAKAAFDELYNHVNGKVHVQEYDLPRTNLDEKSLQKLMESIRKTLKGLYVEKAHGREAIIFLSEDENLCKSGLACVSAAFKLHENKA